jgi:drug/metabolite transporter (DMT)-like permease
VLAGATMISFSAVFVKVAEDVNPSISAFYRMAIGGGCLLLISLLRRERFAPATGAALKVYGLIALTAVFFVLDLESWHRSIQYIGPGLGVILANFQVFFLAAFGALFLGERLGRLYLPAVGLALAGLWLLLGVDTATLTRGTVIGVGLGLLTAFWYTGYILLLRRSQRLEAQAGLKLSTLPNMAVMSLITGAIIGTAALARGLSFAIPDADTALALAAYGLGPQAVGWVLLSSGLPRLPASVAGLLMLLQPALAFIWDILFFARPTGPAGALGAALTIFAIWLGLRSRLRQ